jgi:hypothetical protein
LDGRRDRIEREGGREGKREDRMKKMVKTVLVVPP